MTNRQIDINGYVTIKKNPISKVGVFPYLGKNIDAALEPNKVYFVYRPAEELCKPETIESFKNIPIIDDHTMLGAGQTPAERKGVEGVTGGNVVQEGDYLFADLHIYSDTLKRKIDGDKKDLSIGYRVSQWEPANGTFNGQPYDFIQRGLRGNHVALVTEGRSGKDVSVLDQTITYDHMDITNTTSDSAASPSVENKGDAENNEKGANDMADEDKKKDEEKEKMAKDKMAKDAAEKEEKEKKEAADKKAKDEKDDEEKKKKAEDEAEEKDKDDKKKAEDKKAMDSIADVQAQLDALKKDGLKTLMGELNRRNEVAKGVEAQFGTFDHAELTASEVAAYGLKKAGIEAPAGAEIAVWDAYAAGRKAVGQVRVVADNKELKAPVGSLIEKALAASK